MNLSCYIIRCVCFDYWEFLTNFLTYFLTTLFDALQNSSYWLVEMDDELIWICLQFSFLIKCYQKNLQKSTKFFSKFILFTFYYIPCIWQHFKRKLSCNQILSLLISIVFHGQELLGGAMDKGTSTYNICGTQQISTQPWRKW